MYLQKTKALGVSLAVTGTALLSPIGAPLALADDTLEKCVIAIDPGHNGVDTGKYDPKTGVYMKDYPNGAEDQDAMEVSQTLKKNLEDAGAKVVLLKEKVSDDVTYRERITKAEDAKANVAVSIHTTPGSNYSMVIAQNKGGYREGQGEDGSNMKHTFDNADLAERSQKMSKIVADARTKVEPQPVKMTTELNFGGRAPLWGGNLPVISLLSTEVPWVYSEYGTDNGGGQNPIGDEAKKLYAQGLTDGITQALEEVGCEGGGSAKNSDNKKDKDDKSKKDGDKNEDNKKDAKKTKQKDKGSNKGSNGESRPTTDEDGNKIEWSKEVKDGVLVVTKTVIVEK